jgi:hypothetical protein
LENWRAVEIKPAPETEQLSVQAMLYAIAVVLLVLWFHALIGRRPL